MSSCLLSILRTSNTLNIIPLRVLNQNYQKHLKMCKKHFEIKKRELPDILFRSIHSGTTTAGAAIFGAKHGKHISSKVKKMSLDGTLLTVSTINN